MKILGIDPGIANTGLSIVSCDGTRYALLRSRLVTTKPMERETCRLYHIFQNVRGNLLMEVPVNIVAIEKVFHGKNVSSSISTAKAMGACAVAAAQHMTPMIELTPQQVKCASGLSQRQERI